MINRRAQAILICLWILIALSILSIGIGHRVALGLRLSKYHQDTLKSEYLAKAALNKAIIEIQNNTQDYNCLQDNWVNNSDDFKKIYFDESNANNFAYVGYTADTVAGQDIIYGAIDEERKININTADHKLIMSLLQECGVDQLKTDELATNVEIWRGTVALPADQESYYSDTLKYACKKNTLANIDELVLIKGYSELNRAILEKIKSLITIYGPGTINANTASDTVLKILALKATKDVAGLNESDVSNFVQAILSLRENNGYFTSVNINDMISKLSFGDVVSDARSKILNDILPLLGVKSNLYRITANAVVNKASVRLSIVYNKETGKIVWFHKN